MKLCARATRMRDEHLKNAANAENAALEREIAAGGGTAGGTVQGYRSQADGARFTLARKLNRHIATCGLCSR